MMMDQEKAKAFKAMFLEEIAEQSTQMKKNIALLEQDPSDAEAISELRRAFHSLKSSSAMMGDTDLSRNCLDLEAQTAQLLSLNVACPDEILDKARYIATLLTTMLSS